MSVSESYFKGKLNYKGYKRFFFKKNWQSKYWILIKFWTVCKIIISNQAMDSLLTTSQNGRLGNPISLKIL